MNSQRGVIFVLALILGGDAFSFHLSLSSTLAALVEPRREAVALAAKKRMSFVSTCESVYEQQAQSAVVLDEVQGVKSKSKAEVEVTRAEAVTHAAASAPVASPRTAFFVAACAVENGKAPTARKKRVRNLGAAVFTPKNLAVARTRRRKVPSPDSKVAAPSSGRVRKYVEETLRPVHDMFDDHKEVDLDDLMEETYRVNIMSNYLEVHSNLTAHLGRLPTVGEWASSMNLAVNDLTASIMKSQEVKDRLVRRFMWLVRSVAVKYRGQGVPLSDLMQEGSCGLIHAAERFNPSLGRAFSTYATFFVRQRVSRALANHGRVIRLPSRVHEKLTTMGRARSHLLAEMGRDPTLDEIACRMGMTPKKVALYMDAARPVHSLDAALRTEFAGKVTRNAGASLGDKVAEGGGSGMEVAGSAARALQEYGFGSSLLDSGQNGPEHAADRKLLRDEVAGALAVLKPEERLVIILRFGLLEGKAHSYEEVISALQPHFPELKCKRKVKNVESMAFYRLRKPSTIAKIQHLREAMYGHEALYSPAAASN